MTTSFVIYDGFGEILVMTKETEAEALASLFPGGRRASERLHKLTDYDRSEMEGLSCIIKKIPQVGLTAMVQRS